MKKGNTDNVVWLGSRILKYLELNHFGEWTHLASVGGKTYVNGYEIKEQK